MTTYYNYLGQAMAVSANPGPFVTGSSSGHETITAPAGPSGVSTGGGNYDTLIGSNGDNIFYLNNITDVVQVADGLSGVKSIVSYSGGYTLPANVQNLTFYGAGNWGAGNSLDNLIVMGGNDLNTMDGGGGNDVLVGGFGQNNIGFQVGGGHDVVYNFHTNLDIVRIAGASFTSFGQIQSAMRQVGSDVVLTVDPDDSITFRNVGVGDFQARNFLMPLDRSQLGALTFSDDFNSLQLWNASTRQGLWQTNFGGDPTKLDTYAITSNDEKQLYTAPDFVGQNGYSLAAYNPFSVNNGVLDITAGQFSYADSQHTWGQAYYSGMLNTRGLYMQKYGYFEMRAELPTALGTWPAFWLSQDPYKPGVEADVLEHLAMYPDVNFARTVDAGVVTGNTNFAMPSLSGFHTYGMLWGPSTTTFYIDDLAVMQVATPASWDKPMYMLLDMAVGGWGGPIDAGALPAQMSVDYVHVYGLASSAVGVSVGLPTYTAPSGVNSVTLISSGQTVTANDSGDQLIGTGGPDTFVLGKGGDTVAGGGGADVFSINAVPWAASHITDFGSDDGLNLSGVLGSLNYSGSNALTDGVLRITANGADAEVWAQANGQWSLLTVLGGQASAQFTIQNGVLTASGSATAGSGSDAGSGNITPEGGGGSGSPSSDPPPAHVLDGPGLLFRNGATGDWGLMAVNPAGGQTWRPIGPTSNDYAAIGKGDFDHDGALDVAFRQVSTGDWGYMTLNPGGGQTWHAVGPTSTQYAAIGTADFNGDGRVDIAFRDPSTGDLGFMSASPGGGETWHTVGPTSPAYAPVGVGDFDGDGRIDVAFRNIASGNWGFMTVIPTGGEAWHAVGPTSTDYMAVATADFDGDGRVETAYRNSATGDWGFMSANPGGGETWHPIGPTSPDYAAVANGDFNGDGLWDVAFRQTSTGDWGFMTVNPFGGETWHAVGPSSLSYGVI